MAKNMDYIDLGERGRYNPKNKLNDLTGKEWIKFTKSWFIHSPKSRTETEMLHPAKFPESLAEEFIAFFTKKGQWVLDPFLGTGSTLLAAASLKRNSVGVELNEKYYKIAVERMEKYHRDVEAVPLLGSSKELKKILKKNGFEKIRFDYVLTSPPYWNQLKRNYIRQSKRKSKGLDTVYSNDVRDIGNIDDYEEFLRNQAEIFDEVYDVVKEGGYLTIITNNVFFDGRVYPLAFDTAISLTKRGEKSWVLKDEKIWLQNDKTLVALGVNNAWVGNRHHQYCLIFRKERTK
jgi:DNA modification methylase